MANKTIYFSHSDERYIEGTLPGLSMSLSAALMAGYRLLVERQQATHDGFMKYNCALARMACISIRFLWAVRYTGQ